MKNSVFWLVAGPNGAGKTTSTQKNPIRLLLPQVKPLNADDRTLELLRSIGIQDFEEAPLSVLKEVFVAAAEETFAVAKAGIDTGAELLVETVLSTRKFDALVDRVHERGGFFGFIYLGLVNPSLSKERVARRVRQGGHDVPEEKLASRWIRSVQNVGYFAYKADQFFVFDNSNSDPDVPPVLIAEGGGGRAVILEVDAIPAITESLLAAFGGEPQVP